MPRLDCASAHLGLSCPLAELVDTVDHRHTANTLIRLGGDVAH